MGYAARSAHAITARDPHQTLSQGPRAPHPLRLRHDALSLQSFHALDNLQGNAGRPARAVSSPEMKPGAPGILSDAWYGPGRTRRSTTPSVLPQDRSLIIVTTMRLAHGDGNRP